MRIKGGSQDGDLNLDSAATTNDCTLSLLGTNVPPFFPRSYQHEG